jgi:type I site-specific restriction-modification system R (restriction) subunit
MSAHAYTEDQLVEQPAIGLFAELGWQTVSALEDTLGSTCTLFREAKGEVVLVSWLRAALERLNPALPPEAIAAAVDELTRDRSATRPAPELSTDERSEVKKVARELLTRLKQLLVINWRQKSAARAQLRLAIENLLDTGLPRVSSPELYRRKCSAVFEHVYESYADQADSIYAAAN